MITNRKSFKYSGMLILTLCSTYAFSQNSISDAGKYQRKFERDVMGDCKGTQSDLDLETVYFLKNKAIKQSAKDGYKILAIDRDSVDIKYYSTNDSLRSTLPRDVSMAVLSHDKDKGSIDIEVNFILLDGQVAVYWKETYLHHLYKQGVFKLENDDLVFFCQGKGGTYTSH